MKRLIAIPAALILLTGVTACILTAKASAGGTGADDTEWENISAEITGGYCAGADAREPHTIYFGTSKGLFKTDDSGLNWKNILRDRNMAINHIGFDSADAKRVYAATSKGIYVSPDAGATWKRIYRGTNVYEANCRTVLVKGRALYAGTKQGLAVSLDAGVRWNKESGELGKSAVLAIAADPRDDGYIYAAASGGVYRRLIAGGAWEKVLVKQRSDSENGFDDPADGNGDFDQPEESSLLRYICVNAGKTGEVYLATAGGVITSKDSGLTWQDLSQTGLLSKDVLRVSIGDGSKLYAATGSDVYIFDNGQWRCVGTGTTLKLIRGVTCAADSVYASCDSGLYLLKERSMPRFQASNPDDEYTQGLPSIRSVQKAAIEYADADIAKIRQWRRQAQHRALLPSVDVGINQDTTDLWHWEGGSTTKEYDDILRKGKQAYDWDVSFKWDLGELIWNDAQTSIDTRSRLLVQLRDDILDEVTKLYFEYVRVRMELDSITFLDGKKLTEKKIRLKEIASQIDGLTDNFFTKH